MYNIRRNNGEELYVSMMNDCWNIKYSQEDIWRNTGVYMECLLKKDNAETLTMIDLFEH
jgi:hypothetical protein